MPKKGSKVFHPAHPIVEGLLDTERQKLSAQTNAVQGPPDSAKTLYFHRCVTAEHRKTATLEHAADFGSGSPALDDLGSSFTQARIKEVLTNSITYMGMLWVLTHRIAKDRIEFVDLTLWPEKLGVPAKLIDFMWKECREIEMTCNSMYPSILGPLNPGWVFRVGPAPTHLQEHMQLKNDWVSRTLSKQHETKGDEYDFMHNTPNGDKLHKSDSKDNFFFHLYKRAEPAGGRWLIYNPATGLPVKLYVKYRKHDLSVGFSWLVLDGATDDTWPAPEHEMGAGESHLFWPKGPPTLKNTQTRASLKRRQDDNAERDDLHGLSHAKIISRTMVPHVGHLSQQERINQHPPIDVDRMMKRDEDTNLRFASGALQGLRGGFDMSDNFASQAAQDALDAAKAKGMLKWP